MAKPILLSVIILFAASSTILGQSLTIVNKTASDTGSKILYLALENRLEIKGNTFKGIEAQDGVTPGQNALTVRPGKAGKLTIIFLTSEGKVPVVFYVKPISDAVAAIGGQTGKTINKDFLLQEAQLSLAPADTNDTLFGHYTVISFTAQLNEQTFQNTGKDFSNELLAAIRKAKKGDILIIKAVKGLNMALNMAIAFNRSYSFELE